MNGYMQWWDRRSSVVRWTIGLGGGLAVYIGTRVAIDRLDDHGAYAGSIVAVLIGAALFLVGIAVQARRLGGWQQWRLYRRAYRTGTIPAGAALDRWRPMAKRQARFFREGRSLTRVAMIVDAVLVVALAAFFISLRPDTWPIVVAIAAAALLALWGVVRLWTWRRRQFARLEAALDRA